MPKTVEESLEIDVETGTVFWTEAIEPYMKNVIVSFLNINGATPDEIKNGEIRPG